jgi:hypothetical protein
LSVHVCMDIHLNGVGDIFECACMHGHTSQVYAEERIMEPIFI